MFRMTSYGHRLSNGGLTDSHLPLDVPGGSLDLGYLPRAPPGRYPTTRVLSAARLPESTIRSKRKFFIGPPRKHLSTKLIAFVRTSSTVISRGIA